jgi:hypothetical protein
MILSGVRCAKPVHTFYVRPSFCLSVLVALYRAHASKLISILGKTVTKLCSVRYKTIITRCISLRNEQ